MSKFRTIVVGIGLVVTLAACNSQGKLEQEAPTPEGQAKAQEVRGLMDQQIQRQQQIMGGSTGTDTPPANK